MKIAVIGGGAWGTTLANVFAKKGLDTRLWVRERKVVAEIKAKRENSWYLPKITLHESLVVSADLGQVTDGADYFLFTVPSQFFRSVLLQCQKLLPKKPVVICANKGIELETLMTMSQVVMDVLGALKPRFAMLSGPSFAFEVSREMPTAVTLGCAEKKLAAKLQETLATQYLRVYTNTDFRGVELGGAFKNIIAIAAGVADGLGFGSNARAALITRGLAEMGRLGKALGAEPATFMGLSGMGDLVLTCTGELSRNRQVGLLLGKGQKLMEILKDMKAVAEGVKTTEAVHALGKKLKVELPITGQVFQVLYEDKDPTLAVRELMTRALKGE
ncbi:MAG: NAD(P)H-dependent glycerol-3-phosphate dehydrogenase [Thermodesulfobacteriota bacterium]|nr:NAD(P)H-dependent glycerol-3-phosphate dehydrogenase [Thermodesulfobacteriota bacterium]